MKTRITVLGAGFGGLELCSLLSGQLGKRAKITLIDKNDTFFFGYSKLDVMFGRKRPAEVLFPYQKFIKPGVEFRREVILDIDPYTRTVTTSGAVLESDILVIALGAAYDFAATPGLDNGGYEFYSFAGAERLRELLPTINAGHIVIGVASTPFKCPPAPSEAAILLHEFLTEKGVRDACRITLAMPFQIPIPPSMETSKAILRVFKKCGIEFKANVSVRGIDPGQKRVRLSDGSELEYDYYFGVPKHRAPGVVVASGMTNDHFIPVDPDDLTTMYPGIYAIGDVAHMGVPKAGMFAESAAKSVAGNIIATVNGMPDNEVFDGRGTCYVEFGDKGVARVDVDLLNAPSDGVYFAPSQAIAREKEDFGVSRRARWFGL